ncbi:hypothetical protein [Bdellovibrio bacteriovorus]|uniref:DUF4189 domain-containing protein n=1 Tax=Bdellovibrio bacteriovorus TaxID=959 RepID=A0A150WC33_BDEBC|nr:hypothetical protein [Bdellovibrio bacteriovorus]KYG60420.1 hypothetical protein AZI85_13205 [Bdellovibrio bacteriovorus]
MSVLRKSLVLVLGCCLLLGVSAHAQSREAERIRILETKVSQLEGLIYNLNQRVSNLEYQNPPMPPPPPPIVEVACMTTDTGYNKVFLGKGRTKLEAEAKAKESCGNSVNAVYCNGSVKCSDPAQDRLTQGALCVLTDTGYNKIFRGEGRSPVEAEYNARKACGNSVNPVYCTASVRCETF